MSAPTILPPTGNIPGGSAKPFSIRLTEEEKRLLLNRAGRLPLGTYLRELALGNAPGASRRRVENPVKDHEALARVLAALGQSLIASSLKQLANAAHIGALPVTPETEQEISNACAAVLAMRTDLMRALGLMEGGGP